MACRLKGKILLENYGCLRGKPKTGSNSFHSWYQWQFSTLFCRRSSKAATKKSGKTNRCVDWKKCLHSSQKLLTDFRHRLQFCEDDDNGRSFDKTKATFRVENSVEGVAYSSHQNHMHFVNNSPNEFQINKMHYIIVEQIVRFQEGPVFVHAGRLCELINETHWQQVKW